MISVTSTAKYSLPSKGGRFGKENFVRYIDLCYVETAYHKLTHYGPNFFFCRFSGHNLTLKCMNSFFVVFRDIT